MKLIQRKTVITVILLILTGFSYSTYAQDIHKAVETGDLATVKKLLEKNPKLALQVDQAKDYPIRAAILNGHTEIAELLITYMDNPDVKDFISKTPLMVAASTGNEKIAALLIAKGAGLNLKTIDGRTPLHYATRQGKEKMAAMLIKKGAKINSQTNKGDTPLRIAIKRHDRRIIDLLLANNAGLKIKDKDDGITLLHKLATLGYHKQVTKLMEQGVDIHSTDGTHRTLLHNAAAGGLDT
ncbi:MAG: ankyrin repeat domain-containing protein, partial [bacterium]|nr:ankyrin repeat domain-containing protein [bacterium]